MVKLTNNSHCKAILIDTKTYNSAGEVSNLASLKCLINSKIYHNYKFAILFQWWCCMPDKSLADTIPILCEHLKITSDHFSAPFFNENNPFCGIIYNVSLIIKIERGPVGVFAWVFPPGRAMKTPEAFSLPRNVSFS